MQNITEITSIDDPRIAVFHRMTEAQLRNRLNQEAGVFIAESPKVIQVALDAGCEPLSLLCEKRHIEGDAAAIIRRCEAVSLGKTSKSFDKSRQISTSSTISTSSIMSKLSTISTKFEVFSGEREILSAITGYTLTRGVLCAMRRPALPSVAEICEKARRLVIIDGVSDTTNIGSIFRSAAALGIDGVLLTPTSCDPLNRRAVRVSMGSVFLVPWTWLTEPIESLHRHGFKTVAMALKPNSVTLDDPRLKAEPRLAIIMGEEGYGLSDAVIAAADYKVIIPMHHNVDSLNVAAASAVAFWELRQADFS